MLGSSVEFVASLLKWYASQHRDMPWRVARDRPGDFPDPYHVLVSEAMLQQTQVATATGYFLRFMERLPTLRDLAAADEQTVLRLWQGLGYYARARNLHKTARAIVERHGGVVPGEVEALRELPGIGPYTAGAVASLAFGRAVPLVDGNVVRVLCRLDCIQEDPRTPVMVRRLWERAAELVPADRPGDFNSALMELGATVCVPKAPACLICPVREHCAAREAGLQNVIPPAKKVKESPLERRWSFCIRRGDQWLMEQRPANGRWASMWQFVTIIAPQPRGPVELDAARTGALLGLKVGTAQRSTTLTHVLSHRRYHFTAYTCEGMKGTKPRSTNQRWMTLEEISEVPLSGPQAKILASVAAMPA